MSFKKSVMEKVRFCAQRLCAGREFETCREILYAVQGHCHPPDKYPDEVVNPPPAPKMADSR